MTANSRKDTIIFNVCNLNLMSAVIMAVQKVDLFLFGIFITCKVVEWK